MGTVVLDSFIIRSVHGREVMCEAEVIAIDVVVSQIRGLLIPRRLLWCWWHLHPSVLLL